ncbi:MAG TPA: GGDEF domain-containing protein [Noviherbaspirillum sp.]|nr:GGDEF domain-containing protein [Noviherbaspirillum sp.]
MQSGYQAGELMLERVRRLGSEWMASMDAQTAIRLKSTGSAAVDYTLFILIMAGFAATGSVPASAVWILLAVALALNALFIGSQWSGLTRRLKDPSITWPQVIGACGINFLAMFLAPKVLPVFIVNLFIPLCYGGLYFSRREFLAAWALLALSLGATMLTLGMRPSGLGMLDWSPAEQLLLWVAVAAALGRFLFINAEVSRLRERLHRKNKELLVATTRLAELASHDELTGLLNRREFIRLLDEEHHRSERGHGGFAVAIVDADHFKSINDRFGHLVGDRVLKELARLLGARCRSSEALARYGGEEFTLLLHDRSAHAVTQALERLRDGVARHPWDKIAPGLRVTISAGAAIPFNGETVQQLLSRADVALYEAKAAGRNRVRLSEPAPSPAAVQAD